VGQEGGRGLRGRHLKFDSPHRQLDQKINLFIS
jgi:hypothetical protein